MEKFMKKKIFIANIFPRFVSSYIQASITDVSKEDKKADFADTHKNIYANKIFQNDSLNWLVREFLGRSQNIDNERHIKRN